MKDLQVGILEVFAEFHTGEMEFRNAFDWRQRIAARQAAYDAERAKLIRCVPELKRRRKEARARYEVRRWQKISGSEELRLHNARRRAAHARLKKDPARLAIAKAKQAKHSSRHAERRRSAR